MPSYQIPLSAVFRTASAETAKVCPRFILRNVSSSVLSMPYSTNTKCVYQALPNNPVMISAYSPDESLSPALPHPLPSAPLRISFQLFQFPIRIGISLKIGQIFHFRVFTYKEPLSFFQLLSNRLSRMAIGRIKCLIITISATSVSYRAVTVRTSKSGINRIFCTLQGKCMAKSRISRYKASLCS